MEEVRIRAILDTSVLIAAEGDELRRTGHEQTLEVAISVVTMAELRLGVLLAGDPEVAARRTETLMRVGRTYHALAVDDDVAAAYAALVAEARPRGRRPAPHDGLIAATARRFDIPLFTRDAGFQGLPGVEAVLV